jgi:hypothetical protein
MILLGILTVLFISFILMILHTNHVSSPPPPPAAAAVLPSPSTLPLDMETKEMILTSSSYNGIIYTDWIRESFHFNYLNYKSLESFLVTYPKANIEMTVIGPQAANYYKLGNLMRCLFFYLPPDFLA